MTSVITEDGALSAVTLLSATPNVITHIKNTEADGYQAIQQGFEEVKPAKIGKSLAGHLKNSKACPKIIREFIMEGDLGENIKIGEKLSADLFEAGQLVDVTGTSKGKRFAG